MRTLFFLIFIAAVGCGLPDSNIPDGPQNHSEITDSNQAYLIIHDNSYDTTVVDSNSFTMTTFINKNDWTGVVKDTLIYNGRSGFRECTEEEKRINDSLASLYAKGKHTTTNLKLEKISTEVQDWSDYTGPSLRHYEILLDTPSTQRLWYMDVWEKGSPLRYTERLVEVYNRGKMLVRVKVEQDSTVPKHLVDSIIKYSNKILYDSLFSVLNKSTN